MPYTASDAEFMNTYENLAGTFKYDGVAYFVDLDPEVQPAAFYRFFNRTTGVHFYTAYEAEKANVIANCRTLTRSKVSPLRRRGRRPRRNLRLPFLRASADTHFYTADTSRSR